MQTERTEGRAKILVAGGPVSRKLAVFYNPEMKANRDITILVLSALAQKKMRIGLPLAGSGVRAVRLARELPPGTVGEIVANDHNPKAFSLMKKNLKNNRVKATVKKTDASLFLLSEEGFDYIDIDPFGSPNSFLDAAVRRLSRRGVLAVTATDTAPLSGTYPLVCQRKYWAVPKRDDQMHERGVRILIRRVQLIGAQYDKSLVPIYSYSREHYFRVFFSCRKGKPLVDDTLARMGLWDRAGPLWKGRLWDPGLAKKVCLINQYTELAGFLEVIRDEAQIDAIGFYDLHNLASRCKLKALPAKKQVIQEIRRKFQASSTHFKPTGVRSDITRTAMERLFTRLRGAHQ